MTQGRFPTGPPETPKGQAAPHPTPDARVARKIHAIRAILRLERDHHHADTAVMGGIDGFLDRWAEDPDVRRILESAGVRAPAYQSLDQTARAAWVDETTQRLAGVGEDSDVPATQPAPTASVTSAPPDAGQPREPQSGMTVPAEPSAPAPSPEDGGVPGLPANEDSVDSGAASEPPVPPPPAQPERQPDAEPARGATAPGPPAPPDTEPPEPSLGQQRRTSRNPRGAASRAKATAAPPTQSRPARAPARPAAQPVPVASLDEPLTPPSRMGAGLKRLGIQTYRDALRAFPRRYLDVSRISQLLMGEQAAIMVTVQKLSGAGYTRRRNLAMTEAEVFDESGSISAVWFGRTWVARSLKRGARFLLVGTLGERRHRAQFNVDTQEEIRPGVTPPRAGDLVPVYPLTEGVTQAGMRGVIGPAAQRALPLVDDFLPGHVRESARLPGLRDALRIIHGPRDRDEEQRARRRLAFDEMFLLQLGLLERRRTRQAELGAPIPSDDHVLRRFVDALPFVLTHDQQTTAKEILADMTKSAPMMRLLQGDVGSGKTVVAAMALVTAAARNRQGALMAPTEILAEQHFRTLTSIFAQGHREADDGGPYRGFTGILPDRPLRLALLTGSMSAGAKSQLHRLINQGSVDLVIGTHALIQRDVEFNDLGLAVVDEQHRFGVGQRASLRNKGLAPHLLVMTATPIPRTMALSIFGDLDVSTIAEMPPGRPRIRTAVLQPEERERAYGFIREQAAQKRQAFIICPLVQESEAIAAKAAVAEYERLSRDVFPSLNVGLLHGRMRPREKESVMDSFRDGTVDVLVSTAVVEVGIDIPNATVMMVDGAERFGLSQLHQYRGRVGRGTETSYCILVSDSESPEVQARLSVMEETSDGFKLAETDLKLRGPGEMFGTRQSGMPDLQIASFDDLELIEAARGFALDLTGTDPELTLPDHGPVKQELSRFWQRASEAPDGG